MPATKSLIAASIALIVGLAAGVMARGPQDTPRGGATPGARGTPAPQARPADDLDARTKAIEETLDRPMVLDIPNRTTLGASLKLIKGATVTAGLASGIPIYVDPHGLQEAGAAIDKPIDVILLVDKVPLRDNLRQVLRPQGLDYVVQDGLISITSRDRAVDQKIRRLTDRLRDITKRLEAAEKRGAKE